MRRVAFTRGERTNGEPYLRALDSVGLSPEDLTPDLDPGSIDGFAGLLLAGGTDVDPSLYGEDSHEETHPPDSARDSMEWRLLSEAIERDLPVLAICRGHQLLNVVQSGTLIQHIESGVDHAKGAPMHAVEILPGSLLHQIAGATRIETNTRHHQAAGKIGKSLLVTARSSDGCVEALEMEGRRFVLGVQWHPEDLAAEDGPHRRLFQAFARQVR